MDMNQWYCVGCDKFMIQKDFFAYLDHQPCCRSCFDQREAILKTLREASLPTFRGNVEYGDCEVCSQPGVVHWDKRLEMVLCRKCIERQKKRKRVY